jgi:hypothetical protein
MPAASQSSRHQSRLSLEMNRDLNRTMASVASSTGSNHGTISTDSTRTDFDPENDEAIMSTHQLDNNFSQRLPELRDTAKKYGRWAPRPQQDFVINTSAIGRAFPDFSQGSSSDDSKSIEIGRGAKTRQRTTSGRSPRAEFSGDMDSSIVTLGSFKIVGTPQGQNKKLSVLQEVLRHSTRNETPLKQANSERKENIPPSSQKSAKGSPYVSHASRTTSGERKTLAELHARVADDSDVSFIGDERPATITFQTKNTRFSNAQSRVQQAATVSSKRQQYADAVAEAIRSASETPSKAQTRIKSQASRNINLTTPNPTQQSFLLPNNMPEVSEIISGTLTNGIPFTRDGKVQSRFSSGNRNVDYGPVDGIPVPDEEEDIYKSLDILKARVADLEMEKVEFQKFIKSLQHENDQLKVTLKEMEKIRGSDSALGTDSGSDGENDRNIKKLISQQTSMFYHKWQENISLTLLLELKAHNSTLQTLLDASERKMSSVELHLKTNTAERDAAVLQLTKAIEDNEHLETDNDILRRENEALRNQLAEFVTEGEEVSLDWQKRESALRNKINRQEEVVKDMQDMTNEIKEIFETTRDINVVTTSRAAVSTARRETKGKHISANQAPEQDLASKVMEKAQKHMEQIKAASAENVSRGREHHHTRKTRETKAIKSVRARSRSQSRRSENIQTQNQGIYETARTSQTQHNTARRHQLRDNAANDASDDGSSGEDSTNHKDVGNITSDADRTEDGSDYASIVGEGFMASLRQMLKEARVMKAEKFAAVEAAPVQDDTIHTIQSARPSHAPSVKGLTGILKNTGSQNQADLTGRLSIKSVKSVDHLEEGHTTRSENSHHRHHSDSSIHTRTNNGRRRNEADDMTSAFIIPDISPNAQNTQTEHPTLSTSARRVLDDLCKHESKNCTVCTRVASFDKGTGTKNDTKQTIRIEKPIPVSERMPIAAPYEDEPTIRPSVEPGLALATVIKGLEDEIAHLKMKQAEIQAAYNKHDSSLGMRHRKSLKKHIEQLLKSIDLKSDQIYALYDVLEGQKQSGQEMSERDVELTLLNLNIDPEEVAKGSRSGGQKSAQQGSDSSDEDSELDLPWEGIEDTASR